jgi:hypothetical protein
LGVTGSRSVNYLQSWLLRCIKIPWAVKLQMSELVNKKAAIITLLTANELNQSAKQFIFKEGKIRKERQFMSSFTADNLS